MSKQANSPPPGDRPTGSAPPLSPAWRNWLWLILIVAIFALFYLLSTRSSSTSFTYSQFVHDVQAHQVKTIELASSPGGTSSATLERDRLHRGHPAAGRPVVPDRAANGKACWPPPRPT